MTISSSKSDAMALIPISAASITIPPVPQNGSRTVPPFFTPVRLIRALANLGCRDMGEKNGLSPTFLFSSRSVSVTLCSMYMWTLSHICILTTTSGSFRLTLFFFDRRAPALRISFWESTSFIIPSNLLARMANVPSGSSTSDSPEMSSGVYSPRYLPMLWVREMRSAMGSRNLSSNDATM